MAKAGPSEHVFVRASVVERGPAGAGRLEGKCTTRPLVVGHLSLLRPRRRPSCGSSTASTEVGASGSSASFTQSRPAIGASNGCGGRPSASASPSRWLLDARLDSAPPLVSSIPRGTGVDLRFLPDVESRVSSATSTPAASTAGRSWTPLAEPRKLPSGIPRDRRHHSQTPRQLIPTRSNAASAKKDEEFYGRISGFGRSTPRFWLGKGTDDEKDRVFGFSSNVGRDWSRGRPTGLRRRGNDGVSGRGPGVLPSKAPAGTSGSSSVRTACS